MKTAFATLTIFGLFIIGCKQQDKQQPIPEPPLQKDTTIVTKTQPVPTGLTYTIMKKKQWQALKDSFEGAKHLDILNAINRVDSGHIRQLDSIIVPSDFSLPIAAYLPFPETLDFLNGVNKIIIFSNPVQAFAAYENGKMILAGQTNTGRKNKPTPPHLYFTNWKAKETISTVNDEWKLKWNFNIHNKWGIGFHEYALPGYPASHSCLRLQESDAKFLYSWADQWMLTSDEKFAAAGTPVIVLGHYPFGKSRPWYKLVNNAQALSISADSLKAYIEPYLLEILQKQEQRQSLAMSSN